jgi:hypothetical protein
MFSRKSKFFGYIIILTLVSFFFALGGCKNLSNKKEGEVEKKPAKQTVKTEKPAKQPKKETAKQSKKEAAKQPKEIPVKAEAPEENIPDDGYIRLVLNEKKGCFTLYYLSDPQTLHYEPLFNSKNSSASFLSVSVDGEVYRLGDSKKFKTKIERNKKDMSFIFESPFLKVTQVFSPVRTSGSQAANGVMITMTLQNIGTERSFVGLRMLLDTELGEGKNGVPILTNKQVVSSELLIEGNSNDRYWISRGKKISLMGSIVNPVKSAGKGPDLVHIANWKRLRDSSWRLPYSQGRSFNNLPYSAGDSAVCYFFGPEMLDRNKVLTYTVFLTTEDTEWYKNAEPPFNMTASIISDKPEPKQPAAVPVQQKKEPAHEDELTINIPALEAQASIEAAVTNENEHIIILTKLQEILNQFIEGQTKINERDLAEIEKFIEKYRIGNETY